MSEHAPASSSSRRGLGRGLELLLGASSAEGDDLTRIPVGSIRPNRRQPRRRFDAEASAGLVESVRTQGVIQPVIVRPTDEGYELVAGERRWRAARAAGLATVPALVRETDERESLVVALVENVAREDLSAVEEARAYAVLLDEFALSLSAVSEHVGRSKAAVSNRLRLLELPEDVLALVERGELSEGHARAVLAVPDHDERRRLARRIVRTGLSVRGAERAAREAGAATRPRRRSSPRDPVQAARARDLLATLTGADVRVSAVGLEVRVADELALDELVEALERAVGPPLTGAG